MDTHILRKLQLCQVEILKDIDYFCKTNGIKYSLYAGTLIGAVRHKGFIPWDDDIDIAMDRENYEKFIRVWNEKPINGYYLHNNRVDNSFRYSFSKIRKDGTLYIEENSEPYDKHNGIFIDIFPIDKIPKKRMNKIKHIVLNAVNLLYLREHPARDNGRLVYLASLIILKSIPIKYHNKIKRFCTKQTTKYNDIKNLKYTDNSIFSNLLLEFDEDLFDKFQTLEFEGHMFSVFGDYKKYLTTQYGDYMKLPKKSERVCKHKPKVLEFENNIN